MVACPITDSKCTGPQWESGWVVFIDTNNTAELDVKEVQLEVHVALEGNNTLRGTTDVSDYVSFFYDRCAQSGTFVLCDQRGFDHARVIKVLATGRIRTLIASDWSEGSCPP